MESRITATDLARQLGDVLGRVRYRGEAFIVERNGKPVARLGPVETAPGAAVREATTPWGVAGPDPASAEAREGATSAPSRKRVSRREKGGLAVPDIRRKVAPLLRRRGVVRAGVFGSVARGEAGPTSDVDFLVEFESGRTLLDLAGLRLDLADVFGRDVDVATPNSLHPALKERILRDLVPIL